MRAILHVTGGPAAGRKIHLRSGQVAQFGRTDWADFSFPADSRMADVHFVFRCAADGCGIRDLSKEEGLTVNGQAVREAAVRDGDRIQAGESVFEAMIDGDAVVEAEQRREEPEAVEAEQEPAREMNPAELCRYLEMDGQAQAIAEGVEDENELLRALTLAERFADAVRLKAHLLPVTSAVDWGCRGVREVLGREPSATEDGALEAAEQWVAEPTEHYRRGAEIAAQEATPAGPGGCLALAAFCSGGSIAPTDLDEVAPDPRLVGRLVAAALTIAAYHRRPAEAPARYRRFLKLADELPKP